MSQPMIGKRRQAAIMFTDIIGLKELAQADPEQGEQLAKAYLQIQQPKLAEYHGMAMSGSNLEPERIGLRGWLTGPPAKSAETRAQFRESVLEFQDCLDALTCAVEIQRSVKEHNRAVVTRNELPVRIGLHLGEVAGSAGEIAGEGLNIASQLALLAESGGICISDQFNDEVKSRSDYATLALGNRSLKNVHSPSQVYSVILPWDEKASMKPAPTALDPKRVAVLPLVSMSPNPDDAYFSDGMTEELISAISKIPGLKVISRTSVMQYKNQNRNVAEIGRELNAGTLLEGSIRKAGSRVRIAVQLIDASSDHHLWAENYDRNLDDVFEIQSDVASKVSGSLRTGVFALPAQSETQNMEAYTAYIRAVQLYHENTEPALREALSLLDEAVSRDPSFARAHVALSLVWNRMGSYGYEDFSFLTTKAEPEAREALRLDPNSAEAYAALAVTHLQLDRFDQTILEAERAIQLNPNVSEAYNSLGMTHCTMGMLDQGIVYIKKAHDLDPLSVTVADSLTLILAVAGRTDEASAVLTKMRKLYPRNPRLYTNLAICHMMRREFDRAQEFLDLGSSINPTEPLLRINQSLLYVFTGKRSEAERVFRELQKDKSESVRTYSKLFIQAALGNLDQAFEALGRGTETHVWPFLIKSLPVFEDLRRDPRFNQFCMKMGLPPN